MTAFVDGDFIPDIRYAFFSKCTPEWKIPGQSLETSNLTYVIKGAAQYTINEALIDVSEGSLLALPKNTVIHANTFHNQLMHYFSVDFSLFNSQNQEGVLPFPIFSQPGRHGDVIRLFRDLAYSWQYNRPGYTIKARGLFLQILHRLMELTVLRNDNDITDPRIDIAIHYISKHFSERITIKMIADMTNMTPSYFGILFKKIMGINFNQYLIQTRIQKAEKMLASGNYKVTNIPEACGFTDISHFYKLFKVVRGFPPSYCKPKKVKLT